VGTGDENRRGDASDPHDDQDIADMWVVDAETGSYRLRESAAEELTGGGPDEGPGRQDRSYTPFAPVGAASPAPGTSVREGVAPARETAPPAVEQPDGSPAGPHPDPAPPRRIRKRLKWVAIAVVGVLLLGAGGLYGYYEYLNSRLKTTQKNAGSTVPPAAADEKGRRPMNILLIGSDQRSGKGNEGYGDDGRTEGLADTTILMHLSADRTNSTLVSIPRDTMVPVPECTVNGETWPAEELLAFNETLTHGGPPCTVSTVDQMLGVQIDHYVMIDFNGVKEMTKAVGGVPICLTTPIDDPVRPNKGGGTDLFLTVGDHRLQGEDALKFLRARHAFGDGSDLARIEAQKGFLMSLAREVKSNASLTNVDGMLRIAQVATGNLTVDEGLGGIDKLIALGNEIKKVPEKRMAFTTLPNRQWEGNPQQRVISLEPNAKQLWNAIASDTPLTKGDQPAAVPTTAVPTAPAIDPKTVQVYVSNASGIKGKGTEISDALTAATYVVPETRTKSPTVAKSVVNHPVGQGAAALQIAQAVGLPATALHETSARANSLELVIGEDFPAELPTAPPTAAPPPAPESLKQKTADQTGCMSKDN